MIDLMGMGRDLAGVRHLPELLDAAPQTFRSALKKSKDGNDASAELTSLAFTAKLEQMARRVCSAADLCCCKVLTSEAAKMGNAISWSRSLEQISTMAQCECFLAGLRRWIEAHEVKAFAVAFHGSTPAEPVPELYRRPAYLHYNATEYDFAGLAARIFAQHIDEIVTSTRFSRIAALELLHESSAGQKEPGALECASTWAAAGLEYSRELDEATRYGCGAFNRLWKVAKLHMLAPCHGCH